MSCIFFFFFFFHFIIYIYIWFQVLFERKENWLVKSLGGCQLLVGQFNHPFNRATFTSRWFVLQRALWTARRFLWTFTEWSFCSNDVYACLWCLRLFVAMFLRCLERGDLDVDWLREKRKFESGNREKFFLKIQLDGLIRYKCSLNILFLIRWYNIMEWYLRIIFEIKYVCI